MPKYLFLKIIIRIIYWFIYTLSREKRMTTRKFWNLERKTQRFERARQVNIHQHASCYSDRSIRHVCNQSRIEEARIRTRSRQIWQEEPIKRRIQSRSRFRSLRVRLPHSFISSLLTFSWLFSLFSFALNRKSKLKSHNVNLLCSVCSDLKGIVSALNLIRDKAQKDGQKKNEETISR